MVIVEGDSLALSTFQMYVRTAEKDFTKMKTFCRTMRASSGVSERTDEKP